MRHILQKNIIVCAIVIFGAPSTFAQLGNLRNAVKDRASTVVQTVQSAATNDPRAVTLLNDFLKALLIEDFNQSAKAVMPFVHKSLLNNNGDNLTQDLLNFSFKKAHSNAKFYTNPVNITRIRETSTTAIGFGNTAEAGKVVDYFIGKKSGVAGMPAPVKVFFPANGGAPKISYMGSL